jgi:uncharacterized membrane-anchored protein YjiN (DUF445 family)
MHAADLTTGNCKLEDPDFMARRALRRARGLATGLLVLMAAVTVGTYWLPPGYWTALLQASAKAGFVGGIADWFAVTALFRHPLGLPIPHTAIIPREKARLGQALGRFMARHVVTGEEVGRLLARFDVADFLRLLLTDDMVVKPLARALTAMLPRILASVEDGRARRTLARLVPRMMGGPEAGRVLTRALRGLVEGGRHQEVLGFILVKLREGMLEREWQLRQMIEERVREQGGRLVGWALGASIATRVLGSVNAEMDRMGPDGSELRQAFDEWVRREIGRMEADPQRAAEMGRAIRRMIAHDTVQAWSWDVWSRLRQALEADAAKPGSRTEALLEESLRNLADLLASDASTRARLQRTAERLVTRLLPAAQSQLASFIADVVAGWDTRTLTDRLELRVGRDLQFVRVNGTVVGFLVGGLAYAVLLAVFGHAAF